MAKLDVAVYPAIRFFALSESLVKEIVAFVSFVLRERGVDDFCWKINAMPTR
jgi:hypothetical protein